MRAFRDRAFAAFERHPGPHDPRRAHGLAAALYEQLRAAVPGWPTPRDREEDLAAHVALKEKLTRIHDAGRGRRDADLAAALEPLGLWPGLTTVSADQVGGVSPRSPSRDPDPRPAR